MSDGWKVKDGDVFDYEADEAEAVVYLIFKSGKFNKSNLFVTSRVNAVKFCEHSESCAKNKSWACAFTTHKRDWRKKLKDFRKDDGRFNELLKALEIDPIYKGGELRCE